MNRKLILSALLAGGIFWAACGGGETKTSGDQEAPKSMVENNQPAAGSSDKGIGKFTNVEIGPLDLAKADLGQKVYDVKCASCHKLTEEKLVGPGWKGVTSRHTPEWIMNFSTNVDEMLAKDPKAIAMLEECLIRMPNQNLADEEARNVLEFMRKNDGAK